MRLVFNANEQQRANNRRNKVKVTAHKSRSNNNDDIGNSTSRGSIIAGPSLSSETIRFVVFNYRKIEYFKKLFI